MAQKTCFLVTSPETFQQQLSNGFSNMESPGPTGKKQLATLLQKNDSSSLSETTDPGFQLVDMLEPSQDTKSGTSGATHTNIVRSWDVPDWPWPPGGSPY